MAVAMTAMTAMMAITASERQVSAIDLRQIKR